MDVYKVIKQIRGPNVTPLSYIARRKRATFGRENVSNFKIWYLIKKGAIEESWRKAEVTIEMSESKETFP